MAPCWIRSAIRTKEYETWLEDHGIDFGEQEDVAGCMMRIASDKSVNGKYPPRSLASSHDSDAFIGRSLMITPRSVAKEGYMDLDKDDYSENDGHGGYLKRTQDTQLVIIEDKWRDDYKVRVYKEENKSSS